MERRAAVFLSLLAACTIVERPQPPAAGVIPDASQYDAWIVERREETLRVIAGSLRAEVTSEEVRFGTDRFALEIIGATRAENGWIFIAADGAVARADDFLGALRSLGQVPRPPPQTRADTSCGRLTFPVDDPQASLWTTDGTAPIAPATGTPPGSVLSAAFLDRDHGMIVIDGGELFETRDGGASFKRVEIGGQNTAIRVHCAANGLHVATYAGSFLFDRDGKRTAAATVNDILSRIAGYETQHRVLAGSLLRYPQLLADRFGAMSSADRRTLVLRGEELRVIGAKPADKELSAFSRSNQECEATPWGKAIAVACWSGLYRVDPVTLEVRALAKDPIRRNLARFSADGERAAWICGAGMNDRGPREFCIWDGQRVLRREADRRELAGVRGSELILLETSSSTVAPSLLVVDAATGAERKRYPFPPPPGINAYAVQIAALSSDGATVIADLHLYAGPGDDPGERWWMGMKLSDGQTFHRKLPRGATRAVFADSTRGVAFGEDLGKLWWTRDAGGRWEPLPVNLTGRLGARPPDPNRRPPAPGTRTSSCDAGRCTIEGRIVVSFDGLSAPETERVLASELLPSSPQPYSPPLITCALRGDERPALLLEDPEDYQLSPSGRTRYQEESVDVELKVRGSHWSAAWRGRDWLGAYQRSASGNLFRTRQLQILRATREGLVFQRVDDEIDTVWIPAGAAPVLLTDDSFEYESIEDVLALPDGSLAILVSWRPLGRESSDQYSRLLVFDRRGKKIGRRTFYWREDKDVPLIGFHDGQVGLDRIHAKRMFYPLDASPARAIAFPDLAATSICTPSSSPAGAEIFVVDARVEQPQQIRADRAVRVYLRTNPRCLQAVELALGPPRHLSAGEVYASSSIEGDLLAEVYRGNIYRSSMYEIRCRAR